MSRLAPAPTPLVRRHLALAVCAALLAAPLAASAADAVVETPDGAGNFKRRSASKLDKIQVEANAPRTDFPVQDSASATRTDTALRDIPQAISVVTQDLIRDQAIAGMADVVRYVPGMGMAQGEGNRDTPIFRGNGSTADMFVDGMRDDVQYFRDVYNIDKVEVLKGPNAMIFGRGGAGGVLNRVTKVADWSSVHEANVQLGSHARRRATFDLAGAANDAAALRLTGMYEDSDSYRDEVGVERYGFNPSVSFDLGVDTSATVSYERFHDERVADRGVPSFQGRPLDVDPSTYFGDPDLSPVEATVDAFNALLEHEFSESFALRNRLRWADYDKFYQNVFPGAVSADGASVSISAYNNATQRENWFNQTDLIWSLRGGSIEHTVLAGVEFGSQDTDNLRLTGYFPPAAAGGADRTSISVPIANPRNPLPITFRPSATDANNHSVADIAALYVQDQIAFSDQWQAILGLRYDRFDIDFRNNRTGAQLDNRDNLVSPRAGLIFRPVDPVSLYASYSVAYQPRAGEQLSSLSPTNASLDPEEFRNYEIGAKWDAAPNLSFNAAVFRLDRSNVLVPDPADATRSILVDGQRTRGVELELVGEINDYWRVSGGYAWADGEITRTQSATVPAGNSVAQLPEHSFTLWNRFELNAKWGLAVGAIRRGDSFTNTDNRVTLPGYTRVDGAVYYTVNDRLRLQLNAENLLDKEYFPNAHTTNNITPGSPRSAWISATLRF
ncbi:MAG: TonB-dependent siderophore receptor [Chiayiivirga sp.]|uniref:TonB-dependent receptor n=1 Tax=Chiayiivirga sp. TaxID=2041042 RepID=UPI0025BBA50F|nr:TonB-dependent siderophore receptor [Chiayiivirga sp.]MCI1711772.1 TonB-dependent siderophore receptor [Chiayiivirga sp.]MCI1729648.1 TonB-dependent siderophore receptor [Chiayiivirga sp.]